MRVTSFSPASISVISESLNGVPMKLYFTNMLASGFEKLAYKLAF